MAAGEKGELIMRAVLLSIKPEWWEKILAGEKDLEIRKTAPRAGAGGPEPWPLLVLAYVSGTGAVLGQFLCMGWVKSNCFRYLASRSCVPAEDLEKYAGGKSLYHYFFRINMVFVRIFSQMCHCFRQLQKCQRIFRRFHAVTKDRRLISLCDILNRHRFCLPVGCHLIAAARADQNERTFSVRNHLRRVVQKIGI